MVPRVKRCILSYSEVNGAFVTVKQIFQCFKTPQNTPLSYTSLVRLLNSLLLPLLQLLQLGMTDYDTTEFDGRVTLPV